MHPDLESLVTAGKLPAPAAEKLSLLEPGTYCLHPSWGPGKIAGWDVDNDRVRVDFEGKDGHELKLEFAAKSLSPLVSTHVLAMRVADRAAMTTMAEKQAADFVKLVLQSYGGRMMLDQFEEVLERRVQFQCTVRRVAVQVDRDADDGHVRHQQGDCDQLPDRQVKKTVVPHGSCASCRRKDAADF